MAAGPAGAASAVAGALGRVTVQGRAERQKAGLGSRGNLGLLGPQDALDIPFSTLNYTDQLMRDQQSRTLADVLQNDASVRVMTAAQGYGEDFQIRGFGVPSGDVGFNGLFGLASGNRMPAEIMDRVEVLKGPGAMVHGMPPGGSVGGSINILPKRADRQALTRLTTGFTSGRQLGTSLDLGRRFGPGQAWGLRVNGSYRSGEASIDQGHAQQRVAALALDYRGTALRWTLDAFKQREDIRGFRSQLAFLAGLRQLPRPPDPRRNVYGANAQLVIDDDMAATRIEYDASQHLTLWASAGRRNSRTLQDFPTANPRVDGQGRFKLIGAWYDADFNTTSADAGARLRLRTGGIGHTVSLGASHLGLESGNFYRANDKTSAVPSSLYQPVEMPAVSGARLPPTPVAAQRFSGLAVADTLALLDDRLLLTLGLRQQRVQTVGSYDKRALSWLGGLVFKGTESLSVYANFAQGLTRGGTAPAAAVNAGEVFPPSQSRQVEAGVKAEWGTVLTTVNLYQIHKPSAISEPDPTDPQGRNRYSFGGQQRNRGLELSAQGEVIRRLRWLASASFVDARQVRTQNGLNQGQRATGVADRTLSLGADWDVPALSGLGLNGRVIHTSAGWLDAANTLAVPAWTRLDLGARYTTTLAGVPTVLRANVDNVLDRAYWLLSGSYATVATGRTVVLSASFDF